MSSSSKNGLSSSQALSVSSSETQPFNFHQHGKLDLSSNHFHCCSSLNTHRSLNSPLVTNSTSPNNVSSTTSLITNTTTPSVVYHPTTYNPVVLNLRSIPSIPKNVAMNPSLSACSSSLVPHVASSNPHSPSNDFQIILQSVFTTQEA